MNTLFETQTEYRVLTLWQPWASLLVHGIKKIETRPGPTNWTFEKGVYLIHAASKWEKWQVDLCIREPFRSALNDLIYNNKLYGVTKFPTNRKDILLPLGAIIGSTEVTECVKIINRNYQITTPYYFDKQNNAQSIYEPEESFGDYRTGRYAWLCKNPRILKEPILYKGGQGYYQRFKGDVNQLKFV